MRAPLTALILLLAGCGATSPHFGSNLLYSMTGEEPPENRLKRSLKTCDQAMARPDDAWKLRGAYELNRDEAVRRDADLNKTYKKQLNRCDAFFASDAAREPAVTGMEN